MNNFLLTTILVISGAPKLISSLPCGRNLEIANEGRNAGKYRNSTLHGGLHPEPAAKDNRQASR